MEKVCVLGLGYIGLPMATLLAARGFKVHGVDIDAEIVRLTNDGKSHINEPDLEDFVRLAVQNGNLVASNEPVPADVFVIAVPTPIKSNHLPDITYVKYAAQAIAPYLSQGNLVVLESTCPVGITEEMTGWLNELRADLIFPSLKSNKKSNKPPVSNNKAQIFIAHCPERVLPGRILEELVENDRILGGVDWPSTEKARDFYQKFIKGSLLLTCARTAELTKLAENSFRDVNIAFANELSIICDKLSIDVWELRELANRHPRVNILEPGPGVGGHCIAIDPWFIVDSAPNEAKLISAARKVNDSIPKHVVAKIKERTAGIKNPVISCLGLSYKADVKDLRESPAVKIVEQLGKERIGRVLVVEPYIDALPESLANMDIEMTDLKKGIEQADLVVLLVNHNDFVNLDQALLKGKVVIDTRGVWR